MFAGMGLIAISMPVSGIIFSNLNRLQVLKLRVGDVRVKLVNELLNGIRIVKFYTWERAFFQKVRGSNYRLQAASYEWPLCWL